MRVLITGAKGQLGYSLTKTNPGFDIIPVDIDKLDISDKSAVDAFFQENSIDVVINAAAYIATDKAENEQAIAYAVNCTGVCNLAEACKASNARMIHVSTDYVFDGKGYRPYQPNDATDPKCVYGKTKLAGEQALLSVLEHAVVIRTAWLYSAHGNNFMKTMLHLMKERDELLVVADQIGTPTATNTLSDAIWKCVKKSSLKGIYHWTDAGVASWYDFAVAIRSEAVKLGVLDESAAKVKPINSDEYPVTTPRPFYSVLDKKTTRQAFELEGIHWISSLKTVLEELLISDC